MSKTFSSYVEADKYRDEKIAEDATSIYLVVFADPAKGGTFGVCKYEKSEFRSKDGEVDKNYWKAVGLV